MDSFVTEDFVSYDYLQVRNQYFDTGYGPSVYVKLGNDTDFFSEEA